MTTDSCDLLVVGSGAGALASAVRAQELGLKVRLIEKMSQWGGTSAISGGAIWLPASPLTPDDEAATGLAYMRACLGEGADSERTAAYVRRVPHTIQVLERAGVRLQANPHYPDYRQDHEGARPGGRTTDPQPFDGALLGEHFHTLRDQLAFMKVFGRMSLSNSEGRMLSQREKGWIGLLLKMMAGYWLDLPWRLKTKRGRRLTMGSSLVAPLGKTLMDRGGRIELEHRLVGLTRQADGQLLARVDTPTGVINILARNVVLGAGGFEHSPELRAKYLPAAATPDHSASPKGGNTGDGLRAGRELGAAQINMGNGWWAPCMRGPMGGDPDAVYVLFMERAFPGSLILNKRGQRLANEAKSYNDFGIDMIEDQKKTGGSADVWLIFDAGYRKRYMVGPMMAGSITPDRALPKDWRGKVYYRADSLTELASQIGLPAQEVMTSVARFNADAQAGRDRQFGRGGNLYDHYFGDAAFANPNLAPVKTGPFYAVPILLGDLGTNGGLATNEDGAVLDEAGQIISGLYAVGNTSASVMGTAYPGAGGTLGPAVTFGIAAAEAAAKSLNMEQV